MSTGNSLRVHAIHGTSVNGVSINRHFKVAVKRKCPQGGSISSLPPLVAMVKAPWVVIQGLVVKIKVK